MSPGITKKMGQEKVINDISAKDAAMFLRIKDVMDEVINRYYGSNILMVSKLMTNFPLFTDTANNGYKNY